MRSEPRNVCGRVGKSCHLPPRHRIQLPLTSSKAGAWRNKAAAIRTHPGAPLQTMRFYQLSLRLEEKQVFITAATWMYGSCVHACVPVCVRVCLCVKSANVWVGI